MIFSGLLLLPLFTAQYKPEVVISSPWRFLSEWFAAGVDLTTPDNKPPDNNWKVGSAAKI